MKSVKLSLVALGMVGFLSACVGTKDVYLNETYVTDFGTYQDQDYVEDRIGRNNEFVKTADWANAEAINLTIRQHEFTPLMVHLKKDVPYIVTIDNRDDYTFSFLADEFFQNTSVAKLTSVSTEEETFEAMENPDLVSFVVPSMTQRSIHIIPVREGRYEFKDGGPAFTIIPRWHIAPFNRGATMGSYGVFIVE